MPGAVVGSTLDVGFVGAIVTSEVYSVAAHQVKATDAFGPVFADPCVLNSDGTCSSVAAFIAAGGTFTTALFGGFAVREVKSTLSYRTVIDGGTYSEFGFFDPGTPADLITYGSVVIQVRVGTPTFNGTMYVRTVLNGAIPAGIVGGVEAQSDGSNTTALPGNVRFAKGTLDLNSCVVVSLLSGAGQAV